MERRQYLAAVSLTAGSLAGCVGGSQDATDEPSDRKSTETQTTIRDGLQVSVERAITAEKVKGDGYIGDATPSEGMQFGLVKLAVTNTAEEVQYSPTEFQVLKDSSQYDASASSYPTETLTWPVSGYYDSSGDIYPGVTVSGWVTAEVPSDIQTATFAWNHTGGDIWSNESELVTWDIEFSEGEFQTSVEISGPDRVESGVKETFSVSLQNHGESKFAEDYQVSFPDPGKGHPIGTDSYDFSAPAGGTDTQEFTHRFAGTGSASVLVGDDQERKEIDVVPQKLTWGETATFGDGSVTITDLVLSDSYTDEYDDTVTADDGQQFALVRITPAEVWDPILRVGETVYEPESSWGDIKAPLDGTTNNASVYDFQIPEDVGRDSITAVLEYYYDYSEYVLNWS